MADKLKSREVDLVVTGLIPTYQRSLEMSFSPPLPYIKVALAGVIRHAWADSFKIGHLLNRAEFVKFRKEKDLVDPVRILLIPGEIGEEFVTAYCHSNLNGNLTVIPYTGSTLDISAICKQLSDGADMFLADSGTCTLIIDKFNSDRNREKDFVALEDVEPGLFPLGQSLAKLALYPVVFAFKKNDDEWKATIENAFSHLMFEGVRALVNIYNKYLNDVPLAERNAFKDCFYPCIRDESVTHFTQAVFRDHFYKLLVDRKKIRKDIKTQRKREWDAQSTGTAVT